MSRPRPRRPSAPLLPSRRPSPAPPPGAPARRRARTASRRPPSPPSLPAAPPRDPVRAHRARRPESPLISQYPSLFSSPNTRLALGRCRPVAVAVAGNPRTRRDKERQGAGDSSRGALPSCSLSRTPPPANQRRTSAGGTGGFALPCRSRGPPVSNEYLLVRLPTDPPLAVFVLR